MFRHILIDEMQDTNAVQVEVVEAIAAAGAGNLTAVGDDAQSIYRFRGADYDNILKFPERHPGARIFQLDVNYRSTPQIVAFTRASIAHNTIGVHQGPGLGPARRDASAGGRHRGRLRGGRAHLPADPRRHARRACRSGRWPCSIATITTASCFKASCWRAAFPTRSAAGCASSSRPTSRTCWPILRIVLNPRDEASWRRLLLAVARDRSGQGRGDFSAPVAKRPAARGARNGRGDGTRAGQEQGLLRGVRQRPQAAPRDRPGAQPRRRGRRPSSREAIRPRSGSSTSGPTTASPTSSSSRFWPPSTTASSG